MLTTTTLTTLFLAGALSPPCNKDGEGYCTDKVVRYALAYEEKNPRLSINTALGDVVSIEFPADVELASNPALGNSAIFKFTSVKEPLRILLWPTSPKALGKNVSAEDLIGHRSNLQIFLDSGITVLLDLKIGRPQSSVQRLVLDFPQRQADSKYVEERITEHIKKHESEYQGRLERLKDTIQESSTRRMAKGVMNRLHCEHLRNRAMKGLVIIQAKRICRIGKEIYIDFRIKNRSRDPFSLATVEVLTGQNAANAIEALVEYAKPEHAFIQYNTFIDGIVVFSATEENVAPKYALKVTEDGGRKRQVVLGGVGF